jgi:hypothetical protein
METQEIQVTNKSTVRSCGIIFLIIALVNMKKITLFRYLQYHV